MAERVHLEERFALCFDRWGSLAAPYRERLPTVVDDWYATLNTLRTRMAGQPIVELQSLRGLAATIVLFSHCFRLYPTPASEFVASRVLNAPAAVVFFFVLSGYVLSASLIKKPLNIAEIASFYIRRLFRIYPAILFACLVVLIVLAVMSPPSGKLASEWFRQYPAEGMAPAGLIALSFLSVSMYLHPMLWTMFIELNASAFMPVIAIAHKQGMRWLLALVLGLSVLSFAVYNHTKLVSVYLVTFAIGAGAPYLSNAVVRLHNRSRIAEATSFVVAVVVVLWLRELIPRTWQLHDPLAIQIEAVASMWIVALTVYRPHGYAGLRHRVLTKLGDISYGIYLLHFPVILMVAGLAPRVLPDDVNTTAFRFGVVITVYIATVAASAACYSLIEMPAVAIGARLARLVRRHVPVLEYQQ